ncbi:MAG TPA: alpha/beta hydrolase family protein [Syntrophobacteraceae bacterium]|nr:alpha/beta hydrolase family protein [Syntrophobacteraceae bacterium]
MQKKDVVKTNQQIGVHVKRTLILFVCSFLIVLTRHFTAPCQPVEVRISDSRAGEGYSAGVFEDRSAPTVFLSSSSETSNAESAARRHTAKRSECPEPADTGCGTERREFFSDACGTLMKYYALVPRGSDTNERYPVLYLLHGAYDGYTAWKDHAEKEICDLVSEYRIVVVTPEGGSFGWYADSRFLKKNQVEAYFLKELIPDVEKNVPTNGLRSIAGLSMGGHGAFVLCLRHPGVFTSVSSMSGILDITRHKKQWRLPEVFGPYGDDNMADWEQHSVLKLIERGSDKLLSVPMLISVSTGDRYSIEENRLVHKQLEKMNVRHLYYESPGAHDWAYWTSQLPLHVSFHAFWLKSAGPK